MFSADTSSPFEELPLCSFSQIRTSDREVALVAAEAAIAPMTVDFGSSRGLFEYHLCATALGQTTIQSHDQSISGGSQIVVEPVDGAYTIEIPVCGANQVNHAGEIDLVAGQNGVIQSPKNRTIWIDDGLHYRAISIQFDSTFLNRRLGLLTGAGDETDVVFDPHLSLQTGVGLSFFTMVANACQFLEAEDSLLSRNYSAVLYEELLLTTLLTGFPHSHSSRFEKSVFLGSSKTVKQAQDYFEQHADKPITVSDVAEAVGVSVRSLQRTFQKITGYSPMRYLYNLRLDRARKRIVNAGPEANITQIAIMSGFTHAGAFSINYKRRFGESPSQTARNYS